MKSGENWLKDFKAYRTYTDEVRVICEAISHKLSLLKTKPLTFLDIGSGTGEITKILSDHFNEAVAVDERASAKNYLYGSKVKFYSGIDKIPPKRKFDFILLSFVLTSSFSNNQRVLGRAISRLSDNGLLCVVTISGASLLEKGFRQYSNTINFFTEQVVRANDLTYEQQVVRASYNIPQKKISLLKRLFNINIVSKMILGVYISKTAVKFNLLHNLLYATNCSRKKVYIFSGLVGVGKTAIAKEFARVTSAYYFDLDLFLRQHAKQHRMNFEKYLVEITKFDKNTISELIVKELDSLSLTKDNIIIDGVFSPEEIFYLKSNCHAKIIPIYVSSDSSERLTNVMKRQKLSMKGAKKYLQRLDRISKDYGGGEYIPSLFLTKINNVNKDIRDLVRTMKSEYSRML